MLTAACVWRQPGLLFPEGAALAFAVLTLRDPAWGARRPLLAWPPPACAALAEGLLHLPLPNLAREAVVLAAVLTAPGLLRSRLSPALSAGLLPLVFGIRSWGYVAAVAGVCVAIALLARPSATPPPPDPGRAPVLVGFGLLALGGLALAGGVGVPLLGAPPLLVVALEACERPGLSLRAWAASAWRLAAAGALGTAALWLPLPAPLSGGLAVAVAAVLTTPGPGAALPLLPAVAVATALLGAGAAAVRRTRGAAAGPGGLRVPEV